MSFGWGYCVWALGLIALGLPQSVHLEYERLEWMMSTPPKEAMVVFMEDGHCLDFNFLKYSFFFRVIFLSGCNLLIVKKMTWFLSGIVVCLCVRTLSLSLVCVCVCLFLKKKKNDMA